MKFPILGLIRLAALLGLGLTTTAVGLGRWNSVSTKPQVATAVRYTGLGGRGPGATEGGVTLLDLDSKTLEEVPLGKQEVLDQASASPRRDGRGRVQVVGRWARFGSGFIARDFGLARLTLPDGKILDRVNTEILPVSPPCWFPGDSPRLLFAAGDGALYRYRFADDDGLNADPTPRRLAWYPRSPELVDAHIVDPEWPIEPALGGRLVLALSTLNPAKPNRYTPATLWWMQLNSAGTAVADTGRLIRRDPNSDTNPPGEERFPTVGRLPGVSSPHLAYLFRPEGQAGYRLRIAPLHRDEATGAPYANASEARELSERCGPVAPHFTLDGSELAYLPLRTPPPNHEILPNVPSFVRTTLPAKAR